LCYCKLIIRVIVGVIVCVWCWFRKHDSFIQLQTVVHVISRWILCSHTLLYACGLSSSMSIAVSSYVDSSDICINFRRFCCVTSYIVYAFYVLSDALHLSTIQEDSIWWGVWYGDICNVYWIDLHFPHSMFSIRTPVVLVFISRRQNVTRVIDHPVEDAFLQERLVAELVPCFTEFRREVVSPWVVLRIVSSPIHEEFLESVSNPLGQHLFHLVECVQLPGGPLFFRSCPTLGHFERVGNLVVSIPCRVECQIILYPICFYRPADLLTNLNRYKFINY